MRLGFKRGDKWYHAITRMLLRSNYSHAAIEVRGMLYESTALKGSQLHAGVRGYPLTDDVASHYEWHDLGAEYDDEALANFELVKGKGYDFFSLLAFLNFNARDSKRLYCYELVLWMLGGRTVGRVTPEIILAFVLQYRK